MNLAVGCVAENNPKFFSQALRLLQSVRWFGGSLARADIYVCVVDEVRGEYREEFQRYGAEVRVVPRFSRVHPPSNKLRFLELSELAKYDRVLLLDCDTLVVRDPTDHLFRAEFTAKIADAPTVPLEVFRRLFSAFDLPMPSVNQRCTVRGEPTIAYVNAGVLAFLRRAMDVLVPAWVDLNRRLIDRIDLLVDHRNYCAQASLSLALAATDITFGTVGNEFNFPIHFKNSATASGLARVDPFIIHYHSLVDPSGHVLPSTYPLSNKRIEQFNLRLRQERKSRFDNRLFWENRYVENPELGSGLGSRGRLQQYKRRLLSGVVDRFQPCSVLDIGCGDMEVSSALPERSYVGLDLSEAVIAANRKKYPRRTFLTNDFLKIGEVSADMVACLDVLIHVASPGDFRNLVRKLVSSTRKVGIVAGDETDPAVGGIVFFHQPLSQALAEAGATNIRKIGKYRHVTVFEFRPPVRQNALLVIGMHRSGTSALTGLLNLLGAYVGDSLLPAVAGVNAKGFWEHVDIVDIHDRLLLALGSSWHDERDLPAQWWTQPGVALFERELAAILLKDFGGMPMWVVKDPRLCRLLPLWRPFFTAKWRKAYVILILRDPREIVQSLARRDQISVERAYLLWFRYLFDAEKWTRDYPRVVVSFEGLLNDWRSVVDRINSELSLDLNRSDREAQRRVDEFLEPNLRHHKNLKPPSGRVACMAVEAYQACLAASASNQLETALAPFVAEVEEVMRLFSSWSEEIQVLEQMRIREINRIKSTVSWRVTAPLRVALNLWRKQRGSSG